MKFSSVIFDIDGTLWDSTSVCADSWNQALVNLKIKPRNFSAQDISGIMGLSHKKIYEKVFPDESEAMREKIAEECYREELRFLDKVGARIYPGVEEGLKKLSENFSLYLVSNCLAEYMELFLKKTGFQSLFLDSLCHGHTGRPKSDNLKEIILKNSIQKGAYIGDTQTDHEAALKAGLTYLHVDYGFGAPAGECPRFDSFSKVVDYLLRR